MVLGFIPPVGEPILPRLARRQGNFDWTFGGEYHPIFLDSGTSALWLALEVAKRHRRANGCVWVPGYGCPDIVAACVASEVEPISYDTESDRPFFLSPQLPPSGMIAVVVAHFVGVAHPTTAIRSLASQSGAVLVEDSAQRFPDPSEKLFGDAVVLSFGRGKPVSLMEGGCLLLKAHLWKHAGPLMRGLSKPGSMLKGHLLRRLHDLMIVPSAFAVARQIPAFRIGAATYRKAPVPRPANPKLPVLATRAAVSYLQETEWKAKQANTMRFIADFLPDVQLLAESPEQRAQRLPRVACLTQDRSHQEVVCKFFNRNRIGSSRMYGTILAEIQGLPIVIRGKSSNAKLFAERIVTVPILSDADIARLESVAAIDRILSR
jgi:dTDP-4-amino-4,6-dideoxygalactose transaminase